MKSKNNIKLISKTAFFPKEGILVVGDLHLGYEPMLRKQGIMLNFNQIEETKKELELIIKKIKAIYTLKKIIFLGDMKHNFAFERTEVFDLRNFLNFIGKFLPKENIILVKGNHDTFTLKDYELRDFYISPNGEIAFIHGHRWFKELNSKKIKTVVMGHIHPATIIKDKTGVKKEKFKCFLIGEYKQKQFIVLPSFFPFVAGAEIGELKQGGKNQPVIKNSSLRSFKTFVVGKNRVYNFGKYGSN